MMKNAKIMRNETRNEFLVVPMTNDEKQEVMKVSEDMGISMSAFTRFVLKRFIKEKIGK